MLFLPVGASALDRTQQGRERQDKPSDKAISIFQFPKQVREKEESERARESERISEYRVKDYIYT